MSPLSTPAEGAALWRSLNELEAAPEFAQHLEKEFVAYNPDEIVRPTRRGFLGLMGASAALAGLTGCRWPREQILPYATRPDNRIPGEPIRFATAFEIDGFARAVLATSVDGRPIKIDGNDTHPISGGKSDAFMQASVLALYDPDRSRGPLNAGIRELASGASGAKSPAADAAKRQYGTWAKFIADAGPQFAAARSRRGAGVLIVAEPSDSPSLAEMRRRVQQALPQATWCDWGPQAYHAPAAGAKLAFGEELRPHLRLDRADVIVSIDDDFLHGHPAALRHARDYAKIRTPKGGKIARLYQVETALTLTGSLADVRAMVRPSALSGFVAQLAAALTHSGLQDGTPGTAIAQRFAGATPKAEWQEKIAAIAGDLLAARGKSVITVGAHLPPEYHAFGYWLNAALGNIGETIVFTEEPRAGRPAPADALRTAVEQLQAGNVELLVLLGGNPAYDAPADFGFADAISKARYSVHLSEYDNETSQKCVWHVNRAHYLEAWGDGRSYDGTITVVQPLIEPLYDGKTPCELLAYLIDDERKSAYEITRRTLNDPLNQVFGAAAELDPALKALPTDGSFDVPWNRALHTGFVPSSLFAPVTPSVRNADWVAKLLAAPAAGDAAGFDLVFRPSYAVHNGEFANCGWLQELPDPLTKLTWDNAAWIAPADAQRLGVKTRDLVQVEHGGASLTLPVFVLPGQVAGVLSLALGYGRKAAGVVAQGAGFDVYPLRKSDGLHAAQGARVTRAGGVYQLVTTQDHHSMESVVGNEEIARRLPELYRAVELDEYVKHPDGAQHFVHLPQLNSMWQEREFEGHRWAMSIDLSTCIGCNACVAACQAENNIGVVGKAEIEMGRDMHWIRVDRYFRGSVDDPAFAHQPVTCHHCELAPCESVCPVAATVHDSEGLNVMVYNRCIGTRYCSNNCPYKVRRFNWFYNHYGPAHPRSQVEGTIDFPNWQKPSLLKQKYMNNLETMVFNPEVTVRSRGVMEKCTFCYQRIAKAKIQAKNEWVGANPAQRDQNYYIPDGTIRTACQEACPTDAIVFGDLSDPRSRVSKLHADGRSYAMLAQLNIKPRLKYLARVENAGPLAKAWRKAAGHAGHDDHGPTHGGGHDADGHGPAAGHGH